MAVVPQPVTRNAVTGQLTEIRNEINVYFNDDTLATSGADKATNTAFYTLIAVNNPGDPLDDVAIPSTRITAIVYDPTNDEAKLTFSDDLNNLGYAPGNPTGTSYLGQRTFRLRIGDQYAPVDTWTLSPSGDPGTSPLTMVGSNMFVAVAGGAAAAGDGGDDPAAHGNHRRRDGGELRHHRRDMDLL